MILVTIFTILTIFKLPFDINQFKHTKRRTRYSLLHTLVHVEILGLVDDYTIFDIISILTFTLLQCETLYSLLPPSSVIFCIRLKE